jgi:cytochrome c oxidase assembly protein subunit 11
VSGQGRRNATAFGVVALIGCMVVLTASAVPLYRLFCKVTGYGGTTQVAERAPEIVDRAITVRFNADVQPDLPWVFAPAQREVTVKLGENRLAFFKAANRADRPLVGTATFNVTPHVAGPYFSKIACFCFTEQVLEPGRGVEMPVSFFVDPAILDDPETADLREITLSYTFFLDHKATAALASGATPGS